MRRSTKKKVIPLALALALALIGAALAVPTFNLNVQQIGEGGPTTITVPGGVTTATINWVLDTNPDYIKGVSISFDQALQDNTKIIVKLYGSDGSLLDQKTYTVSNNGNGLAADTSVEIDFSNHHEIKTVDKVAVVLVGPQQ